jgi:hypothetical protein
MAGTVAAHVDETTRGRLREAASSENRSPSQIVSVALRAVLELTPAARRALFAIDGIADEAERAFASRLIGRSAVKAYERILDARHSHALRHPESNTPLDSEEAIDAEAVRLSR